MPPLLTHRQSFGMFIRKELPVVDKTLIIQRMLDNYEGPYFLARPRKFGKTFLLDTIRNIAEGNRHLFSKLSIGQTDSGYDWHPFPVIRLDLSDVSSNPKKFSQSLTDNLVEIAENLGVNIPTTTPESAFSRLITRLSRMHEPYLNPKDKGPIGKEPQNVVLLIDEYNMPLVATIGKPNKTESIRSKLHDFYSVIKKHDEYFRFVFVTGVTKFDQLSVLSGLNNLKDITLDHLYSEICGFTKSEMVTTFRIYLELALDIMKSKKIFNKDATLDDLVAKIEKWYNGYSWNAETFLFNPYSVMNCINTKTFSDFWYDSGTQFFIHKLGLGTNSYYKLFSRNLIMGKGSSDPSLLNNITISDTHNIIDENEILFQAGYLTIDRIVTVNDETTYFLKIPNSEIRDSIFNQFIKRLTVPLGFETPKNYVNRRYQDFFNAFCSLDVAKTEELFTSFITSVPFYYSLKEEWIYCTLLFFCLNIGKHRPIGESVMIKGRADLILRTPANDWIIIEVKHEKPHNLKGTTDTGNPDPNNSSRVLSMDAISASTHDTPVYPDDFSTVPPPGAPSGEIGPMKLSEAGNKSLEKNIRKAFEQIVSRRYSAPYFGGDEKIYAAAVAVYDSSFVRIRFQRIVWKSQANHQIELMKVPKDD